MWVWALLHWMQFLSEVFSCMGSPWPAASFRAYPPAPTWSLHWLQCGISFSSSLCELLGSTFSSTTSGVIRKSLLRCLQHFLSLFLLSPWCLQDCFIFLIPLSAKAAFLSFSKYTITEATLELLVSSDFGRWWVWFGTSWNWLFLTRGQLPVSSDKKLHTPIPHWILSI